MFSLSSFYGLHLHDWGCSVQGSLHGGRWTGKYTLLINNVDATY